MAFRFRNFKVYQDAKKLHYRIIGATREFPRRASLSIVLQIAEGSAKSSDKEFNRYLKISMGSASEVASGLEVGNENNLIGQEDCQKLLDLCEEIANQLGGFSKKLLVGG